MGQAQPLGDALPDHPRARAAKEAWLRHFQAECVEQAAECEARAAAQRRQPRRITQLCAMSETLYALCDDGTVWERRGATWLLEPAIPQRQLAED